MNIPGCNLPFEKPAIYHIQIGGRLPGSLVDRLSGLKLVDCPVPGDCQCTTLEGLIRDQAQLMGIIDTLHTYHHSIIEIRVLTQLEETER